MIAIDTNILVRYFVDDSPSQTLSVRHFFETSLTAESPGFIASLVLVELIWVLEDVYDIDAMSVIKIVQKLLHTHHIVIEHEAAIERALHLPHKDLADSILHEIGKAAGCSKTVTFDKKFARLSGVELLDG